MWCGALFVACVAALCGADIVFPGNRASTHNVSAHAQIPLDLMLRLSEVRDMSEFLSFVDQKSLASGIMNVSIPNRISGGEEAVFHKNAVCTPEMQVVELIKEKNTSMVYFPMCARLEQCGGCCASELLSCQPTQTETVKYLVYASTFAGQGQVSVREKIIVSVEKHTECQCKCAVKRENCDQLLHVYEEENCLCRCMNSEDEQRCLTNNDTKTWDSNNCTCSCRRTQNCSTGFFYDPETCRCARVNRMRRRGVRVGARRTPRRRIAPTMPLPVLPLHPSRNRWPPWQAYHQQHTSIL